MRTLSLDISTEIQELSREIFPDGITNLSSISWRFNPSTLEYNVRVSARAVLTNNLDEFYIDINNMGYKIERLDIISRGQHVLNINSYEPCEIYSVYVDGDAMLKIFVGERVFIEEIGNESGEEIEIITTTFQSLPNTASHMSENMVFTGWLVTGGQITDTIKKSCRGCRVEILNVLGSRTFVTDFIFEDCDFYISGSASLRFKIPVLSSRFHSVHERTITIRNSTFIECEFKGFSRLETIGSLVKNVYVRCVFSQKQIDGNGSRMRDCRFSAVDRLENVLLSGGVFDTDEIYFKGIISGDPRDWIGDFSVEDRGVFFCVSLDRRVSTSELVENMNRLLAFERICLFLKIENTKELREAVELKWT